MPCYIPVRFVYNGRTTSQYTVNATTPHIYYIAFWVKALSTWVKGTPREWHKTFKMISLLFKYNFINMKCYLWLAVSDTTYCLSPRELRRALGDGSRPLNLLNTSPGWQPPPRARNVERNLKTKETITFWHKYVTLVTVKL